MDADAMRRLQRMIKQKLDDKLGGGGDDVLPECERSKSVSPRRSECHTDPNPLLTLNSSHSASQM
eukprot:1509396-Prymnesium_polylepis.1